MHTRNRAAAHLAARTGALTPASVTRGHRADGGPTIASFTVGSQHDDAGVYDNESLTIRYAVRPGDGAIASVRLGHPQGRTQTLAPTRLADELVLGWHDAGRYEATLTVADEHGRSATATHPFTVAASEPPVVTITSGTTFTAGEPVPLTGTAVGGTFGVSDVRASAWRGNRWHAADVTFDGGEWVATFPAGRLGAGTWQFSAEASGADRGYRDAAVETSLVVEERPAARPPLAQTPRATPHAPERVRVHRRSVLARW